jgi:hypothetical protein
VSINNKNKIPFEVCLSYQKKETTTAKRETRILDRIGKEEIIVLTRKIWQGQNKIATEIGLETLVVIREKYEADPTFFSGKSAKRILAGLFYLLGQRYRNARTQRQIAIGLGATEVTVATSCHEWAEPLQQHYRQMKTK